MRTLVGAAEPPPKRPVDGYSFTQGNTAASGATADVVLTWLNAIYVEVSPWQAVVLHQAYERQPYRTIAVVDRRLAIEGGE